MNNLDDMPLYISMYKLLKYLYLLVRNFRKEYKYTLLLRPRILVQEEEI